MATIATTPPTTSAPSSAPTPSRRRRFHYADNVYFIDGHIIIGVLLLLLYLIVAVSLDAAGYVENMTLLVWTTVGAFGLGLLMSFSRFDGFFALSHALFTGLAWILFLMTNIVTEEEIAPFLSNGIPPLQAKAYFVLLQWLNWVEAAVNSAASEDNYVFIFEIGFLLWWLTFLGVWAVFRYGYTWRAIVPAGVVLVINTYYAPQSVLMFLVIFSLVALVLLVRTNLAERQLRWREQHIYFSPDITLDFMRNAMIYSVIVLAIAWIAPGLGRSTPVRTVLAPVSTRWETFMQDWNRLYEGLNRQATQQVATFGTSLTLGGARTVSDSPVFQAETPQGRYWRAVVYDYFNGRTWENTAEEQISFDADEPFPTANWQLRTPLTQTITLLSPTGYVMFGAPDLRSADVAVTAIVWPQPYVSALTDAEQGALDFTSTLSRRRLEMGDSYTVISQYADVTQQALREASDAYPQEIRERYLQLPEDFSPRVRATAQEVTVGLTTAYDRAKAVETYLRAIPYNDAIAAPPDGVDPVEYFLYDIREGYCDYYATAMVTMLRSLGIPSRTASGYAQGTFDEESGIYIITDRDAHTWVEVFFPEYGWIEFEPTAGEDPLQRPSGADEFPEPRVPGMPEEFQENLPLEQPLNDDPFDPSLEQLPEDNFFGDFAGEAVDRAPWWIWAIVTPLVLLGAALLLFRTRMFGPNAFTPDLPPILFERLQMWAQRLGIPFGEQQTPYEQARRLSRALPEGRGLIDDITDTYVLYRFSNRADRSAPVDGEHVVESWEELRPMLQRAWLRKNFMTRIRRKQNPYSLVNRS